MTEEYKKKLMAKHAEEIADQAAYDAMAKEARMQGMHKAAGILQDISDEEHSHADLLSHILLMEE